MQKYLEEAGVEFQFNTEVTNVLFEFEGNKKIAKAIECKVNGVEKGIEMCIRDRFRVVSIPTLILFKDGAEVKRFVGLTSKEELKSCLLYTSRCV